MKILLSVILATLFTAGVLGTSDDTDITSPNTTEADTTSTEAPVTTTVVITTSQESSTNSSEPQTTTSTAEPPSSTTVSSTTIITSTEVPVTTKAPKPTPPTPNECSWNITQKNVTCMRVELKALFTISTEGRKEYIALTQNATSDLSDCYLSNDTQKLVLTEPSYTLTMIFAKDAGKVFVNSTSFSYTLPEGSGTEQSDKKLFAVKPGSSYKCKAEDDISLGNVTMAISEVQIQAFGEKDNTGFGAVEECDADDKVSDAVPIAVGCALAALIIIVLIAYLVGRRQSRQKGYQSV